MNPPQGGISKEQWVELFEATGLNEATMQRWHQLFEARYPEGHASFLTWLGESAQEVERIRRWSRESATGQE
ncbi:hypothetical protein D0544_04850 [Aestuariirhabdus litorea]|uniref:Uncharacterized protein n=2 Tax=Aestuariirhabdus litorea TaxID=2528527 RepID=A0A3P3VVH3_9GAMM|nr:hypothetical protein D0544_04850 [Aestuariirhabdus litorea]RWW98668.1 hypothetical protein DZC74_04840 [Endozoicomonadaceae bacterium GTF-13]